VTGRRRHLGVAPLARAACATACAIGGAIACDDRATPAAGGRSEQVIATGPAAAAASPGAVDAHPVASAVPTRRKLCEDDADAAGRSLPRTAASHAEAPGAEVLDGSLRPTPGQWTWISFWAAWCAPCREEIPRLFAWRDRLARGAAAPVRLVFVSLDDDGRQLTAFLAAQPASGLRSTLWLPDGKKRTSWLASLRLESAPELPVQALADGAGRIRCVVRGAVEDGDYDQIAALVR